MWKRHFMLPPQKFTFNGIIGKVSTVPVELYYKMALLSIFSFCLTAIKRQNLWLVFSQPLKALTQQLQRELSCWAKASPVTMFHFSHRWAHVTEKAAWINPTIKKESCKRMYSYHCNCVVLFRPEMRWRYFSSFSHVGDENLADGCV